MRNRLRFPLSRPARVTLATTALLALGACSNGDDKLGSAPAHKPAPPANVCEPGVFRCTGDDLEHCDDGSEFVLVETCYVKGMCDAAHGQCDVCPAGATACATPTELQTCTAEGQGIELSMCSGSTPFCAKSGDGAACVECLKAEDCASLATDCADALCKPDGSCGTAPKPMGLACGPMDDPATCDGQGICRHCAEGDGKCTGNVPTACVQGQWMTSPECTGGMVCLEAACSTCVPTFDAPVSLAVDAIPLHVLVVDLNGDGKADIASGNGGGKSVSVLLNLGNGMFAPHADYALTDHPVQIVSGDVNGDGKPDLAAATGGGDLKVLHNLGGGVFGMLAAASVSGAAVSLAVGDVNGDGLDDLASTSPEQKIVSVALSLGGGLFAPSTDYNVPGGPSTIAVADVSGDAKRDLVIGAFNGFNVFTMKNLGGGSFDMPAANAVTSGPFALTLADLNGDGKLDVATANYTGNDTSVLFNDGAGAYHATAKYGTGASPIDVATADLNVDGKVDVVVANYSNDASVSIVLNQGKGPTFAPKIDLPVGAKPHGLATGDVDGDGKTDLVVVSTETDTVLFYRNTTMCK